MVAIGGGALFYSWALFILLPGSMLVIASLPLWCLFIWWLPRVARRRQWHLSLKIYQWLLCWLLAILLVILAPIYAYFYGYYHATRLFEGLNIEARELERKAYLIDRLGDIGIERRFIIAYEVLEPLNEAEAKIWQQLGSRPGWRVAGPNPNALSPNMVGARCIRPRYFGQINQYNFPTIDTGLGLHESGRLGIQFIYEQPRSCTDIR